MIFMKDHAKLRFLSYIRHGMNPVANNI